MIPDVSRSPEDPGSIFVSADAFTDLDAWHATAAKFRQEAPIHRVETEGYVPFWALTRWQDVWDVERQPELFPNTLHSVLFPTAMYEQQAALGQSIKSLVQMDDPEHKAYRRVTNDWFKPANLRRTLEARIGELATQFIDRMEARGGECDFAREIGLLFPLHVIMTILGVPEEDEPKMLLLTQRLFGPEDPEFSGTDGIETSVKTTMEFFEYFGALSEARRAEPRDDIASVLANSTVDGEPMGDLERLGYYMIVATAGHDTTSSSLNTGLEQLCRHPDQLRRLQEDPSGIDLAVDEIIRFSTPVRHFLRYATADCEVAGQKIPKGDAVLLSYLSANRDETKFPDPERFDTTRENAGDHLAFGTGIHFCLGAHLARLELRLFFKELLSRLEHIELAGPPTYVASNFVGGPKNLPVRYRFRA